MTTLNTAHLTAIIDAIRAVSAEVTSENIGRDDVVKATWLSLVAGKPAFFLGSPGVTKTGTIRAITARIEGARYYRALMPGVTGPDALFYKGNVIEETVVGDTKEITVKGVLGKAFDAQIFFADEAFKTPDAVLNPVLDFANGDGFEHEGAMVKTPLMAFLAASNELPDPSSNLAALWSRMTIRVFVRPLSWERKMQMVDATHTGSDTKKKAATSIPLSDIEFLRRTVHLVEISADVKTLVRKICEEDLVKAKPGEFDFLFEDDRRFKRVFDVLQAHALLNGRTTVTKADLAVLSWLLWDTPEQIPVIEAVVAPYCRTAIGEARQLIDELLVVDGNLHGFAQGESNRASKAIAAVGAAKTELGKLIAGAGADAPTIQKWVGQFDTLVAWVATGATNPSQRKPWDQITALFNA